MPDASEPTTDITATPEFQAAVAAATAQATKDAVAEIMKQVTASRGGTEPAVSSDDRNWARELAMSIAQLTDQGSDRKRVAPEVLAAMEAARTKMVRLIVAARELASAEPDDLRHVPEYQVVNKTYLNETFIEPFRLDPATKVPVPNVILWDGVPNECMRPMNDVAGEIFGEFVKAIGGSAAARSGKYAPDNRAFSVTPGGLVVKGLTNVRRQVANLDAPMPDPFLDRLNTRNSPAHDPRAEFVNVLGTIAPPARQNQPPGGTPQALPR